VVGGYVVERAQTFSEGLAVVETDQGKCGYIDTKGALAIKPLYDKCTGFWDGIAFVAQKEHLAASNTDRLASGFINSKGEAVVRLRSGITYGSFAQGLISYTDGDQEWGVMRQDGERLVKPSSRFRGILGFEDGFASFSDGTSWGVLNKQGEIVVHSKYDAAFVEGDLVEVKQRDKWGFVDLKGNEVIRLEYDDVSRFFGSRAFAKEGSRWVLIDRKGRYASKRDFEEVGIPGSAATVFLLMQKLGLGVLQWLDLVEWVQSDFFDPGAVEAALPLSGLTDRSFAGVPAWATVSEVLSALSLSEKDVPQNAVLKLSPKAAGPSATYSMEIMFDRPLRQWFSTTYDPAARATGARIQVTLQGKASGRGADVGKLITSRFDSLQQYGIKRQENLSNSDRILFANDRGEYIAVVQIQPNSVAIQFQFSADLLPHQ
jgi:hypothetical protein